MATPHTAREWAEPARGTSHNAWNASVFARVGELNILAGEGKLPRPAARYELIERIKSMVRTELIELSQKRRFAEALLSQALQERDAALAELAALRERPTTRTGGATFAEIIGAIPED